MHYDGQLSVCTPTFDPQKLGGIGSKRIKWERGQDIRSNVSEYPLKSCPVLFEQTLSSKMQLSRLSNFIAAVHNWAEMPSWSLKCNICNNNWILFQYKMMQFELVCVFLYHWLISPPFALENSGVSWLSPPPAVFTVQSLLRGIRRSSVSWGLCKRNGSSSFPKSRI